MRFHARVWLLALLTGVLLAALAPAVAQAGFGVEKGAFYSLPCSENEPIGKPKECTPSKPAQFFTQAGGHPNFGITDLTFNEFGTAGNGVKSIRTDLPSGFSTNPQALPQCTLADFAANLGTKEANECNENTEVGEQEITIVLPGPTFVTLTGTVYNLVPQAGSPSEFGIDLELPFLGGVHVHSYLVGGVSWHKEAVATEEGIESGDYHEYFTIKVAKSLSEGEAPIVRSRLIFNGKAGIGFLTNPTACPGPQTTTLRVEPYVGAAVHTSFTTSTSAVEENCGILKFEPKFVLTPSTTQLDKANGVTTDLEFPLNKESSEVENSYLKNSTVTLPEGLTINPSAAAGLEVCTPEQFAVGTEATSVSCPPRSVIGSAVLNVPGLPPETLKGNIYLGEKAAGTITGPPYTIFVEVASTRYGQIVRTEGTVAPNLTTGQLTTTFANNPPGPFSDAKLSFNGGSFADLANPLKCGAAVAEGIFTSYSGLTAPAQLPQFIVDSNGSGGACASTPPFAPLQATSVEPPQAGGSSTFTLSLERPEGQQYLTKLQNVLPAGLVGTIPVVTLCEEAAANLGKCTSASQIGTVSVAAGSGEPYVFHGKVFLTGPYQGAPYGLSIVVPEVAGPFNLGSTIARAKIEVDPHTARVIATDNEVPTIVKGAGIPIRLRSLSISINRQGFERNPTNCGALATESTLTGSLETKASVSTPFQVEGCSALPFKPTFSARTSGKTSKAAGASLETTINQPAGQANIKSVLVQLPKQLPSRLTTLQKACPEATFAASPASCPTGSMVGSARANTPVLPGKMTGTAYLVSHAAAAFPDLDLVLDDNGVRVILVGNTNITHGITTTKFASSPDVPVSSITVSLPQGPHSALAANGNLCRSTLVMPTTITAQNGAQVKQNTKIAPTGCGVQVVGRKVIGNTAFLTIKTFAAGRISARGASVVSAQRSLRNATSAAALKVPLSRAGRRRHRPFKVRLHVTFVPTRGARSSAYTTVTFR